MPDEAKRVATSGNGDYVYNSTANVDSKKKEEEDIEILKQYKDMLDM